MSKETFKVLDVELEWAFLGHKNTKGEYASNKYEVTLIMTPEQAATFKEHGIAERQKVKPAKNHEGMYQITIKSELEPKVYDKTGKPMSTEEKDTVGNGSKANVEVGTFEVKGAKFAGISRIVVKDLKEYHSADDASDLIDPADADLADDLLQDD